VRATLTYNTQRADGDVDPALYGELESVGEEIEDDLLPHVLVDIHRLLQFLIALGH
jgi:hypothetical protein